MAFNFCEIGHPCQTSQRVADFVLWHLEVGNFDQKMTLFSGLNKSKTLTENIPIQGVGWNRYHGFPARFETGI